nr:c-type cytochrome [Pseudomonadales bacterium]
ADGRLVAYAADSGKQLWEARTFGGVQAGPVSYAVDGRQYIATGIGWGGGHGAAMPDGGKLAGLTNPSRIAVYALDGTASLEPPAPFTGTIDPPPLSATPEQVRQGAQLYMAHCGYCHASGSGGVPDLNYLSGQTHGEFMAIVRGGVRLHKGMPAFHEQLTEVEAEAVHAFIIAQAQRAKAAM